MQNVQILSTKHAPIMASVRPIQSHQYTPTQPFTSTKLSTFAHDSAQLSPTTHISTSEQPTTVSEKSLERFLF